MEPNCNNLALFTTKYVLLGWKLKYQSFFRIQAGVRRARQCCWDWDHYSLLGFRTALPLQSLEISSMVSFFSSTKSSTPSVPVFREKCPWIRIQSKVSQVSVQNILQSETRTAYRPCTLLRVGWGRRSLGILLVIFRLSAGIVLHRSSRPPKISHDGSRRLYVEGTDPEFWGW